jgi:hypothetical protein
VIGYGTRDHSFNRLSAGQQEQANIAKNKRSAPEGGSAKVLKRVCVSAFGLIKNGL